MKVSTFRLIMGSAILCGLCAWTLFLQGCKGKAPGAPVMATPPPPVHASNIVDDFEDGNLLMSVDLAGAASEPTTEYVTTAASQPESISTTQPVYLPSVPLGVWVASSWGGNTVNSPYLIQDGQGALGSNSYIHLFGPLTEPVPAAYASYQLEGKLMNGAPYDALTPGFTGIRFYYRLGSMDNCPQRRFNLAIRQELPPGEGGNNDCNPAGGPNGCYDHFGADLPATPVNSWTLKSYSFSSLTQQHWGHPVPEGLMIHRPDFVKLVWINGRNGAPGTSYVDYAVDEVEFF